MSEGRENNNGFTNGQIAIIQQMIEGSLTDFRRVTLMGDQGICKIQHQNIELTIQNAVRNEMDKWKSSISGTIVKATLTIIITQILLNLLIHFL